MNEASDYEGYCWVCQQTVSAFEYYGLPPRWGRCPHCAAKPRTRALWWYLRYYVCPLLDKDSRILEVGPSRVHVQRIINDDVLGHWHYLVIDQRMLRFHYLLPAPHRFICMNVAQLGFADSAFSVVLCCNVLPYVSLYIAAIAELYRCLSSAGIAIMTTAFHGQETLSVAAVRQQYPKRPNEWFAENGDAWVFGNNFLQCLSEAGFKWRWFDPFYNASPTFRQQNGLKSHNSHNPLLLAARSDHALHQFTLKKLTP